MGGFCSSRSDLDVLVVAEFSLPCDLLRALGIGLAELSNVCPAKKGLELSIITREAVKSEGIEVPYELHFSPQWRSLIVSDRADYSKHRTDSDLPAHLYHTARRGAVLLGEPIHTVFGTGDRPLFLQSVLEDLCWILGGRLEEDPAYGILNICRALMLLEGCLGPYSKEEGGIWGTNHLPHPHSSMAEQALQAMRGEEVHWDPAALAELTGWTQCRLAQLDQNPHESYI